MKIQHKKTYWFLFLLAAAAFMLFYCRHQEQNQEKVVKVIYIPKTNDITNDFWCAVGAGVEMAVRDYRMELVVLAPTEEGDITQQNIMIQQAIKEKPDVILLAPASFTETKDAADQILQNGIKLVLIDSELEGGQQDSIISTDNYEAGKKMTSYVLECLKEDSKILIVNHVKGTSTAIQREKGFRDGLLEVQSQIAGVLYTDSDYQKAYEMTKEFLEKNPDVDIVAGLNEYSAVGAAKAIRELSGERTIHAVGFDNSIEEIQLLEKGDFGAIVIQNAFNMGYIGTETAYRVSIGQPVKERIDSGSELITKENMYTQENQKLLFPFYD